MNGKIIGIIVAVLVVLGGIWYFVAMRPAAPAQQPQVETPAANPATVTSTTTTTTTTTTTSGATVTYTDNGFSPADGEVEAVVRAAAHALASQAQSVTEARPACLPAAYDIEMKFIGPDGGDSLRTYLRDIGSTQVHPLLTGWLEKLEPYRTDLAGLATYWTELDAYRAGAGRVSNLELHIFPGIQHGYMMPAAKAYDAPSRAFSLQRALAILNDLRAVQPRRQTS